MSTCPPLLRITKQCIYQQSLFSSARPSTHQPIPRQTVVTDFLSDKAREILRQSGQDLGPSGAENKMWSSLNASRRMDMSASIDPGQSLYQSHNHSGSNGFVRLYLHRFSAVESLFETCLLLSILAVTSRPPVLRDTMKALCARWRRRCNLYAGSCMTSKKLARRQVTNYPSAHFTKSVMPECDNIELQLSRTRTPKSRGDADLHSRRCIVTRLQISQRSASKHAA